MSDAETPSVDLTTLWEVIKTVLTMGGTAILVGYPACRLMFGERKWRKCSKEEKSIFSVAVGGGFAVLAWICVMHCKSIKIEYRLLIDGNEVYLTVGLLLLIALVEVILSAILAFANRVRLRRRRRLKT